MSHVADVSNEVMAISVPVIGLVGMIQNSIASTLEHQALEPMRMAVHMQVVQLAAAPAVVVLEVRLRPVTR